MRPSLSALSRLTSTSHQQFQAMGWTTASLLLLAGANDWRQRLAPTTGALEVPTTYSSTTSANLAPRKRHASELLRHPRVFIYTSTKAAYRVVTYFDKMCNASARDLSRLTDLVFGRRIAAALPGTLSDVRDTGSYGTGRMLLFRLLVQASERRTMDPRTADLFLIAVGSPRSSRLRTCQHLLGKGLSRSYPHLSLDTASRHVIASAGDIDTVLTYCFSQLGGDASGAVHPDAVALLELMPNIIHEQQPIFDDDPPIVPSHLSRVVVPGSRTGARTFTVPFPSGAATTMAAIAELRARVHSAREVLLTYVGSVRASPGVRTTIRQKIAVDCKRRGRPACNLLQVEPGEAPSALVTFLAKRASTFCAEPGGLNEIRRGLADAFLCGCIPVVFLPAHRLPALWPLHGHSWINDSLVHVDPRAFDPATGAADLVELLSAIPPDKVALMQRTLAENVVRLAYIRDVVRRDEDDAIDVSLKGWAFGLPPGSTHRSAL